MQKCIYYIVYIVFNVSSLVKHLFNLNFAVIHGKQSCVSLAAQPKPKLFFIYFPSLLYSKAFLFFLLYASCEERFIFVFGIGFSFGNNVFSRAKYFVLEQIFEICDQSMIAQRQIRKRLCMRKHSEAQLVQFGIIPIDFQYCALF